jgi:NAD(P)-dependent dehydrogenase (short-subunit alcohol dehydrogenase family)
MPFDLGLADRVAVVTGAAQGIGAQYAAALAEQASPRGCDRGSRVRS